MGSHRAYLDWLRAQDSEDDEYSANVSVAIPPWKSASKAASAMSKAAADIRPVKKQSSAWWDDSSEEEDDFEIIREDALKIHSPKGKENATCAFAHGKKQKPTPTHGQSSDNKSSPPRNSTKYTSFGHKKAFGTSEINGVETNGSQCPPKEKENAEPSTASEESPRLNGPETTEEKANEFRRWRQKRTEEEIRREVRAPSEEVMPDDEDNDVITTLDTVVTAASNTTGTIAIGPGPERETQSQGRLRWRSDETLEVERIAWDDIEPSWEDEGRSYFYESAKDRKALAKQRQKRLRQGLFSGRTAWEEDETSQPALPPIPICLPSRTETVYLADGQPLRGILKPVKLLSPRQPKKPPTKEERERSAMEIVKGQILETIANGAVDSNDVGAKPVLLVLDAKCLLEPENLEIVRRLMRLPPTACRLLVPHQVQIQIQSEPKEDRKAEAQAFLAESPGNANVVLQGEEVETVIARRGAKKLWGKTEMVYNLAVMVQARNKDSTVCLATVDAAQHETGLREGLVATYLEEYGAAMAQSEGGASAGGRADKRQQLSQKFLELKKQEQVEDLDLD